MLRVDLRGVNVNMAIMSGMDFTGSRLSGAQLNNAVIKESNCHEVRRGVVGEGAGEGVGEGVGW